MFEQDDRMREDGTTFRPGKMPRAGGNRGNHKRKGSKDKGPRPLTPKTGNRLLDMADTLDAIAVRAAEEQRGRLHTISAAMRAEAKSLGAM